MALRVVIDTPADADPCNSGVTVFAPFPVSSADVFVVISNSDLIAFTVDSAVLNLVIIDGKFDAVTSSSSGEFVDIAASFSADKYSEDAVRVDSPVFNVVIDENTGVVAITGGSSLDFFDTVSSTADKYSDDVAFVNSLVTNFAIDENDGVLIIACGSIPDFVDIVASSANSNADEYFDHAAIVDSLEPNIVVEENDGVVAIPSNSKAGFVEVSVISVSASVNKYSEDVFLVDCPVFNVVTDGNDCDVVISGCFKFDFVEVAVISVCPVVSVVEDNCKEFATSNSPTSKLPVIDCKDGVVTNASAFSVMVYIADTTASSVDVPTSVVGNSDADIDENTGVVAITGGSSLDFFDTVSSTADKYSDNVAFVNSLVTNFAMDENDGVLIIACGSIADFADIVASSANSNADEYFDHAAIVDSLEPNIVVEENDGVVAIPSNSKAGFVEVSVISVSASVNKYSEDVFLVDCPVFNVVTDGNDCDVVISGCFKFDFVEVAVISVCPVVSVVEDNCKEFATSNSPTSKLPVIDCKDGVVTNASAFSVMVYIADTTASSVDVPTSVVGNSDAAASSSVVKDFEITDVGCSGTISFEIPEAAVSATAPTAVVVVFVEGVDVAFNVTAACSVISVDQVKGEFCSNFGVDDVLVATSAFFIVIVDVVIDEDFKCMSDVDDSDSGVFIVFDDNGVENGDKNNDDDVSGPISAREVNDSDNADLFTVFASVGIDKSAE